MCVRRCKKHPTLAVPWTCPVATERRPGRGLTSRDDGCTKSRSRMWPKMSGELLPNSLLGLYWLLLVVLDCPSTSRLVLARFSPFNLSLVSPRHSSHSRLPRLRPCNTIRPVYTEVPFTRRHPPHRLRSSSCRARHAAAHRILVQLVLETRLHLDRTFPTQPLVIELHRLTPGSFVYGRRRVGCSG